MTQELTKTSDILPHRGFTAILPVLAPAFVHVSAARRSGLGHQRQRAGFTSDHDNGRLSAANFRALALA